MLSAAEATEVVDVAFAPSDSSMIYGLTDGPAMIFWIDNSVPATVDSLKVFHLPVDIVNPLSMHMKDTLSEVYFLTYS